MAKKPKPTAATNVRRVSDMERAMAIRAAGGSYVDIASTLGCTEKQAQILVEQALKASQQRLLQNVETARTLELERLEQLHRALWKPALENRDTVVVKRLLDISAQRSKIAGLYKEPTVPVEVESNNDATLRDRLADALARVVIQLAGQPNTPAGGGDHQTSSGEPVGRGPRKTSD